MSTLHDNAPFSDSEIPAAMARIVDDAAFPAVAAFVYPELTFEEARQNLLSITSVRELQGKVMRHSIERVLSVSHSSYTYHLGSQLKSDTPYLLVSNHRAITFDAMLVQYALYDSGFETSQIIFGNNLLSVPLFTVAARANKMVGIDRGGNPREFYRCLHDLSAYLRETIMQKGESVWIAQGNGRTKDGKDLTDPAIVKMFAMSASESITEAIADLNPVPVSIAYEYEPCDAFKAIELAKSRYGKYQKAPDEDFRSVLTDLVEKKGRIHLEIGNPITSEQLAACGNDARQIAALFDRHIVAGFRLFPNNFVAHDLRSGVKAEALRRGLGSYASRYTSEDVDRFESHRRQFRQRVEKIAESQPSDFVPTAEEIFLNIYANPIDNALSHGIAL